MSPNVSLPSPLPDGSETDPIQNSAVVERVERALDAFLASARATLDSVGPDLAFVADAARDFVFAGGKRVRPLFAYWGWRCVHSAGAEHEDGLIVAAASLELLHASALVHDDLIDASATRRGRPAAHAMFATLLNTHPARRAAFGNAAALLFGDLLLTWSSAMLGSAALPAAAAAAARSSFDVMSAEMMAGQYLDTLEQSRGGYAVEAALRVARFKSSKYTVERPLLLGAGAGGAPAEVLQSLSNYGVPLGEAFQLRDDILGVFGDPDETGKPAGDDVREGKRTVLVALAHAAASPAQRARLEQALDDPELDSAGVDAAREIISDTGAVQDVEALIAQRLGEALAALDAAVVRPDARRALVELAAAVTARRS